MSEPMVRVVDVRCPVHGRGTLDEDLPISVRNGDKLEPWITTAEEMRTTPVYCDQCDSRCVIATEPVDLEPREEQAG